MCICLCNDVCNQLVYHETTPLPQYSMYRNGTKLQVAQKIPRQQNSAWAQCSYFSQVLVQLGTQFLLDTLQIYRYYGFH